MSTIRSIRGMNDIVPADMPLWHFVEDTARRTLESYGYEEIRPPLLERTELFARSIGEVTDIVEKEMYTFADRNGDSLSLRPECTASVVRACIEQGLIRNQTQRLWYAGPMFRHERPQKGRYRQFYQIGAEAFGMPGPQVDAELILLLARLWRQLGIEGVQLELNTLGTSEARRRYRGELIDYLRAHHDRLDEDSRRRLDSNPLRVLDSKNPDMQALVEAAPRLMDHVDAECTEHFQELQAVLGDAGVPFIVNHRLVRGLDYYSRTVFEWTTDRLGAQGTVCGGGRYDGLVRQIGGADTPGVGFSMGVERLVELLQVNQTPVPARPPDAYLVALGDAARRAAHPTAERLRDAAPGVLLQVDAEDGSPKAKFRRADRSGARLALVLGDDELASGHLTVKPLRDGAGQQTLDIEAVAALLCAPRCPG